MVGTHARVSKMLSSTTLQVSPERLMQFTFGFAPPLMIETAIRYGVFDILDSGAKSLDALCAETGTSPRGLRMVLDALVGLDVLSKNDAGYYALTEESASFFLRFVEDIFPIHYPGAQALARALGVQSELAPISVLDLAAGSGVWSVAIAQQSPQIRVTAVDWPDVIAITKKVTARYGLADRYTFVAGDLHSANFAQGHTIATLGHILHSEGESRSRRLLRKTFEALTPGGTIAIAEILVDTKRRAAVPALIFAVNMLVNSDEGDTFSFEEIRGWLQDAGFGEVRTVEAPGLAPLLILATKPNR